MTTATVEPTSTATRTVNLLADVRAAHRAAAAVVASLDLDDRRLWRQVDRTVAELAASAYRLTAAITGGRTGPTARNVPPVVRVRTLATGQQRLFAALDRHPAPDPELLEQANHEVRTATDVIRSVAAELHR